MLHSVQMTRMTLWHLPSKQTGEYATDDEETGTTAGGEKSIEVFDLPETEDILSPSELDATKLYQKFREVKSKYFSSFQGIITRTVEDIIQCLQECNANCFLTQRL